MFWIERSLGRERGVRKLHHLCDLLISFFPPLTLKRWYSHWSALEMSFRIPTWQFALHLHFCHSAMEHGHKRCNKWKIIGTNGLVSICKLSAVKSASKQSQTRFLLHTQTSGESKRGSGRGFVHVLEKKKRILVSFFELVLHPNSWVISVGIFF